MILYHGSNVEIHSIDLSKSLRGKDFGLGFYLSEDKQQAEEMATFKALQYGGTPIVNAFEFDEKLMKDFIFNVKRFDEYSLEWAKFIFDRVGVQIRNLIENNITIDVFLQRLKYIKGITFQYYFGSQQAVNQLKRL